MKSGFRGGVSLFCSWQRCADSFKEQWGILKDSGLRGVVIWKTRFKDVCLLNIPDGAEKEMRIVVKNYRERRFFRYFFRPSLAAREAAGFQVVRSLGIPTAEVLAFGEKRFCGSLLSAFFVTKYEEGTESLLFLQEDQGARELLLELLKENIRYLAKLHAAGFAHGGAHPRNILWRKSEDGSLSSVWIDLATCRKAGRGKRYWKYILTDLSDMTEVFRLTQPELDMLMAAYRQVHPIPVCYKIRDDREGKFSRAVRL